MIDVVDGFKNFSNACWKIMEYVQNEHLKPQTNNDMIPLCDDIELLAKYAESCGLDMMRSLDMGCRPTFYLLSKAGDGMMIPIMLQEMPQNHDIQAQIALPLSLLINLAPVDAYFFVSEIWIAEYNAQSVNLLPSERDDRKEALMVLSFMRGKSKIHMFEINRTTNKEDITLGALMDEPGTNDTTFQATNLCMMNLYENADKIGQLIRDSEGATKVH